MLKKLMLFALAIAALAVPASASAQVNIIGEDTGEPVKVGEFITALSHNTVTKGGTTTLACPTVGITGELTENGPHVTLDNVEVTTEGTCLANGAFVSHITAVINGTVTIETNGKGVANGVTFESLTTLPSPPFPPGSTQKCHFANPAMPLTWTAGSINIGGANNLTGTGAGCPAEAEIAGNFDTLYREVEGEHVEKVTIE